jgi:uncharacterized protein (DUF983 family)
MSYPYRATAWAILRQRCPQCHQGKVFAGSLRMHELCPVCQIRFEREPGYFLGAMYFSYFLMTAILLILMFGGHLIWPDIDLGWMSLLATAASLPVVPLVFRYSRVIWIAYERWAWPDEHSL